MTPTILTIRRASRRQTTVGKISIDDVQLGMVPGQDVSGQNGMVLAARGTPLSEEHLRALRAFGVRYVDVADGGTAAGVEDAAEAAAENEARCREMLRPRFAALDLSTAFGKEVFDLAVRRAADCVISENLDLDAFQDAPLLSTLPPEQHLFGARGIAPDSLVTGEVELATLPEIYVRLLRALHSENTSAQELAGIIGRDPSLTAKLLKLVNSPHFASRTPVDTILRAVSMVGQTELTSLILGLAALSSFSDIAPGLCDMRAFWRHAAACGTYAGLLAGFCPGAAGERVFVGGLLHDIGQLVILRKLPAAAGRALLLSRVECLPISEAETAVLGFDHAAVGRVLLARWNFPDTLADMAANHHKPDGRPESRETALVHIADILATAWAWPAFGGAPVPALHEKAWASLGLSETVLAEVAATGDNRIREIESVFFTESTGLAQ